MYRRVIPGFVAIRQLGGQKVQRIVYTALREWREIARNGKHPLAGNPPGKWDGEPKVGRKKESRRNKNRYFWGISALYRNVFYYFCVKQEGNFPP
jgi:hypothetical protein